MPTRDHESLKPFYLRPRLGLDGLLIRTHLLESPSKCISPPIVERRRTKALDDRPGKGQLIRSYPHPQGISSNLRSALLISHSLCSELSAVHRSELSKAAKRSISLTQPYQIRRGCHASLGRRRTKRAKLFCILRAIKQEVQSIRSPPQWYIEKSRVTVPLFHHLAAGGLISKCLSCRAKVSSVCSSVSWASTGLLLSLLQVELLI